MKINPNQRLTPKRNGINGNSTGKELKADAPLKLRIAFDEAASARSAEVLIQHVASDVECETRTFRFDELLAHEARIAAALSVSAADILVIAVRDDRRLPAHVKSWLALCLGLRDEDAEGAMVVLAAESVEESNPDALLWNHLETMAAIGRMVFFPSRPRRVDRSVSDSSNRTRVAAAPRKRWTDKDSGESVQEFWNLRILAGRTAANWPQ